MSVWNTVLLGLLTTCCFSLVVPASTGAEIYKWVDEQGNVHFQDHPPQEAGRVKDIEVRESSPVRPQETTPAPSVAAGSQEQAVVGAVPAEQKPVPMSSIRVELYYVDWCRWCKKAREFFRSQGVQLTEYDIEKDSAAAARKKDLDPEKGVPFAIVNGVKINGYSPERYTRALKTPPPGSP